MVYASILSITIIPRVMLTPVVAAFAYNEFEISGTFVLISVLLVITLILTFCINTPYTAEIKKRKRKGL